MIVSPWAINASGLAVRTNLPAGQCVMSGRSPSDRVRTLFPMPGSPRITTGSAMAAMSSWPMTRCCWRSSSYVSDLLMGFGMALVHEVRERVRVHGRSDLHVAGRGISRCRRHPMPECGPIAAPPSGTPLTGPSARRTARLGPGRKLGHSFARSSSNGLRKLSGRPALRSTPISSSARCQVGSRDACCPRCRTSLATACGASRP